jgi:hypothetical protein
MTLAGTPTAVQPSGTDLFTSDPAPIVEFVSMVMPVFPETMMLAMPIYATRFQENARHKYCKPMEKSGMKEPRGVFSVF